MANRILGRHGRGLMTTTKAELLALLDRFDDDQLVAFSYDYGDHCHTEAIVGITRATEEQMTETAYSPSGFAVAPELADDEDCGDLFWPEGEDDAPSVVVLS